MQLVNEFYKEPFNEDIIGSFLSHPIDTPMGKEPRKKKVKWGKDSNDLAKVQNKWMKHEEQGQ